MSAEALQGLLTAFGVLCACAACALAFVCGLGFDPDEVPAADEDR